MADNLNLGNKKSPQSMGDISDSKAGLNNREADEQVDLKKFLYRLYAAKWVLFGSIAAGGLLALLVALLVTPTYQSNGTMLIKQTQQGSSLASVLGGNSGLSNLVGNSFGIGGGINIGNEQEVLESRTLLNAMAEKLLANPIMENGRMYPVLWKEWPEDSTLILQKYVAGRINENIEYELLTGTSIIEITYESPSPIEAARMVDLAMETYQEVSKKKNTDLAFSATDFLDSEETEIQDSLASAERNLEQFMDNNDVVQLEAQTSNLINQYAELTRKRYEAEAQLQGVTASIEEYEERLNELRPGLAEKLANAVGPNIEKLQFRISELKTQKALLYSKNPGLESSASQPDQILNLNSQITQLEERVKQETDSLVASRDEFIGFLAQGSSNPVISTLTEYSKELITLRIERLKLRAQIEYLTLQIEEQQQFLENVPENTIQLARLTRNVKVLEELYLGVTKQRAQLNLSGRAELGNSRPLDESTIPEKPSSPNFLLYFLIGTFTAGFLSVGYIIFDLALSSTIHSIESIRKLGIPVLTVVPAIDTKKSGPLSADTFANASEVFHRLANNVLYSDPDNTPKTISVASSLDGEGKTTVTANLAIALSQLDYKVIVIDADLNGGGLDTFFNANSGEGFSEVMFERAALTDCIQNTGIHNIHYLSSGSSIADTAGMLQTRAFKDMVSTLEETYDFVLFDTSTVGNLNDATDLATISEATIVVAQFGRTKIPELQFTLEQLNNLNASIPGVVLNRYDGKRATEFRLNAHKYST